MKKFLKSTWGIGLGLVLLSVILHYVHYRVFHDLHHTLVFLVADIAFVPLEVFFVTMVLEKLLDRREKEHLMEKLNMLVGLFYNEIGLALFKKCVDADPNAHVIREVCLVNKETPDSEFDAIRSEIASHSHKIDIEKVDLNHLKNTLGSHKDLMVNLISNPSLLEHDTFSDLLMAVFHLNEELMMRTLPETQTDMTKDDLDHLTGDLERIYQRISAEWVAYMKHLKHQYPFLYATAIAKNPYDSELIDTIQETLTA